MVWDSERGDGRQLGYNKKTVDTNLNDHEKPRSFLYIKKVLQDLPDLGQLQKLAYWL